MRTHAVAALVCIALAGLAVRERGRSGESNRGTPEAAVHAMLDAARRGDVESWLALYAENPASSFRAAAKEQGEAAFRTWLQSTGASVKGVALEPAETLGGGSARVQVEYVFADRNEKQMVYLRRVGEAWKIERLESATLVPALIPYGASVN